MDLMFAEVAFSTQQLDGAMSVSSTIASVVSGTLPALFEGLVLTPSRQTHQSPFGFMQKSKVTKENREDPGLIFVYRFAAT